MVSKCSHGLLTRKLLAISLSQNRIWKKMNILNILVFRGLHYNTDKKSHGDIDRVSAESAANALNNARGQNDPLGTSSTSVGLGHDTAQFNLGIFYANGRGVRKNEKKAIEWFRLAAEQGHKWALELVSRFVKDGLCPHCVGGKLKGLFSKKCTSCGKSPK